MEPFVDQVRRELSKGGTAREIAMRLGIPDADWQSRQKVRSTLQTLMKQGEATFEGVPRRYVAAGGACRKGEIQAKIWRFLKVKAARAEYAAVSEAVRFSGASHDYAKRYLRFLAEIEAVDTFRQHHSLKYRLAPKWQDEPAPRWNRRAQERER